jgi:hypothetical protein
LFAQFTLPPERVQVVPPSVPLLDEGPLVAEDELLAVGVGVPPLPLLSPTPEIVPPVGGAVVGGSVVGGAVVGGSVVGGAVVGGSVVGGAVVGGSVVGGAVVGGSVVGGTSVAVGRSTATDTPLESTEADTGPAFKSIAWATPAAVREAPAAMTAAAAIRATRNRVFFLVICQLPPVAIRVYRAAMRKEASYGVYEYRTMHA